MAGNPPRCVYPRRRLGRLIRNVHNCTQHCRDQQDSTHPFHFGYKWNSMGFRHRSVHLNLGLHLPRDRRLESKPRRPSCQCDRAGQQTLRTLLRIAPTPHSPSRSLHRDHQDKRMVRPHLSRQIRARHLLHNPPLPRLTRRGHQHLERRLQPRRLAVCLPSSISPERKRPHDDSRRSPSQGSTS